MTDNQYDPAFDDDLDDESVVDPAPQPVVAGDAAPEAEAEQPKGPVLRTRPGHVFQHGIDGVDDITSDGTVVPESAVEEILSRAKPFGSDYVVVDQGNQDQG